MATTERPMLGSRPELATARAGGTTVPAEARVRPAVSVGTVFRGLHPIIFAVYPILFLWSQNVGEAGPADVGDVLAATFLAGIAVSALAWLAFQDRARGALFVAPVILGFLIYGHVANFGLAQQAHHAGWLAVTAAALIAALKLPDRWIDRIDRGLRVVAVALVAIALVTILPTEIEEATTPRIVVAAGRTLPGETAAPRRDVYWLVYDRYGSDRSFEVGYGVENDMTAWLEGQGFEVLKDSHANYVGTSLSLATTMNMTPLDELTRAVPQTSGSYQPVYRALQDSLVVRQFQALGYRYLHLGSWWNPTRTDSAADRNYNADGVSDFTSAVLEESLVPILAEAFLPEELPPTESAKHLKHNTWALDVLDRLPRESGPKLVFAHVLLPHPPYVFDRDGRYIPPAEAATIREVDAWHRQLDYTNSRLREFISGLLAKPENERPIIILQADEGPWPERYGINKYGFDWATASDREVEMKFGIMNAWYVPGGTGALGLRQDQTAINTFPVLFDRYYGLDYPMLPDRVFASSWGRPYRSIEITERVAGAP